MKKLFCFLSEHRYFYRLLLLVPVLVWFRILEHSLTPVYMTQTALDRQIPFLPVFVVPYLLWFAYIAYGVLYTGIHSKEDFCRLLVFLGGGMTVANLMFGLFPNAQGLRPEITAGDSFSLLVKFIYDTDTPTNVCPSVHVINALAVDAALRHSDAFAKKRFGRAASLIFTALVCLSTVFIKQHAVLDVFCGFAVAALFYIPLYVLPARRSDAGNSPGRGGTEMPLRRSKYSGKFPNEP